MTLSAAERPTGEKRTSSAPGFIDDRCQIGYLADVGCPISTALNRVVKKDSIAVGEVEHSQWVCVQGRGNFMSSPRLKEYVEGCLESESCSEVVVDLVECPSMDSTFMGTLAGLGGRLLERDGKLWVVGLSERNRDSLVDLGLDAILELESESGQSPWADQLETIREGLTVWSGKQQAAAVAEEVLEAHRKLCEIDDRNQSKFGAVLEVLEGEVNKPSSD